LDSITTLGSEAAGLASLLSALVLMRLPETSDVEQDDSGDDARTAVR
jgi:hypothetical protein